MRVGYRPLSVITFAFIFSLAVSLLDAEDLPQAGYRLQPRAPSTQYRLVEPRPKVLSRGRIATVTSLSNRQRQVLGAMNHRGGDGGGDATSSKQQSKVPAAALGPLPAAATLNSHKTNARKVAEAALEAGVALFQSGDFGNALTKFGEAEKLSTAMIPARHLA